MKLNVVSRFLGSRQNGVKHLQSLKYAQGIRRYSKSVASLRYHYMTKVVKYFERVAPNQTVLL